MKVIKGEKFYWCKCWKVLENISSWRIHMRPFLLASNEAIFKISSVSWAPNNAGVMNWTAWLHTMGFLVCLVFFHLSADKRDWKEAWNGWRLKNLARSYFTEWKSGGERMRSQRNRKDRAWAMAQNHFCSGGMHRAEKQTETGSERNKTANGIKQQRKQKPVEDKVCEAVCQTPQKHCSSEIKVLFLCSALLLQCHRWITLRLTLMSLRAHKALPHMIRGWLMTDAHITVHFVQ